MYIINKKKIEKKKIRKNEKKKKNIYNIKV